jgi:hypothetical protein
MKTILSIALLSTIAFANIDTNLKKSDFILKDLKKVEKKLIQKSEINYITVKDLKKLNKALEGYEKKLHQIENSLIAKNVDPKKFEKLINKVAIISKRLDNLSRQIREFAQKANGIEPKVKVIKSSAEKLNNIALELEMINEKVSLLNLPQNVRGNIVLDQSIISENVIGIQEEVEEAKTFLLHQSEKIYKKANTKKDETIVAAVKSNKQEKQEEQDEEDKKNQQKKKNQNPLMQMMANNPMMKQMANNPMMQQMMGNGMMGNGMMGNGMMGNGMMGNGMMGGQ